MRRTEELKAKIKGMARVGLDGTPCTHEWDGTTLIVTSASGTTSADLKGKTGDKGEPGYTPQKNVDYFDGKDGKDGYTPIKDVDYFDGKGVTVVDVKESTDMGGANIVTFSDGSKLTVRNGEKGADGTMSFEELTDEQKASLKGADGYTPRKGVDYNDGYTPVRGVDYWTASDKAQMVSDVLNSLPTWNGGSY